ncbi:Myotubularin family [Phytophthora cactorum]|nr:Myotubularin family [Phytophthora cactorum]
MEETAPGTRDDLLTDSGRNWSPDVLLELVKIWRRVFLAHPDWSRVQRMQAVYDTFKQTMDCSQRSRKAVDDKLYSMKQMYQFIAQVKDQFKQGGPDKAPSPSWFELTKEERRVVRTLHRVRIPNISLEVYNVFDSVLSPIAVAARRAAVENNGATAASSNTAQGASATGDNRAVTPVALAGTTPNDDPQEITQEILDVKRNWSYDVTLQLARVWNNVHKENPALKGATLSLNVYNAFMAAVGGSNRSRKAVDDKMHSMREMYRFMKNYETKRMTTGDPKIPWFDLTKPQRRAVRAANKIRVPNLAPDVYNEIDMLMTRMNQVSPSDTPIEPAVDPEGSQHNSNLTTSTIMMNNNSGVSQLRDTPNYYSSQQIAGQSTPKRQRTMQEQPMGMIDSQTAREFMEQMRLSLTQDREERRQQHVEQMSALQEEEPARSRLIGETDVLAAITSEFLDENASRKDTSAATVCLGRVFMTTFRFQFVPDEHEYDRVRRHLLDRSEDEIESYFLIPLGCIASIKKKNSIVEIFTKDLRQLSFRFDVVEITKIFSVLTTYVFPDKIEFLFAFYHRLSENMLEEEPLLPCVLDWDVYDDQTEWERQGVFENGKWRVTSCNENFRAIDTYPERLVVPVTVTDEVLLDAMNFRSLGRIPCLSWLNGVNGATLCRSSQPKIGMSKATSPADESLVAGIASSSLLQDQLQIIDCRPMSSALIASLAQIFIDPFFRTWKGFQVLIEKEWLSFGHPFHLRHSHGEKADTQESPIFIQFLDCVSQLVRIYPSYFEFNEGLLLMLADALHSCRFGTFLFDCKKHRQEANLENRTTSVWTWVNGFRPQLTEQTFVSKQVLNPPLTGLLKRITLWDAMFMHWSGQPLVQEPPISTNFFSDNSQRTLTWQLPQGTLNALNAALTLKYREARLIQELEERIAALEEKVKGRRGSRH